MLALTLSADLSGITKLAPTDTEENPHWYTFKVQCTSCRETHPNWVGVNRHEMNELSNSRGEANFVWRCKNCKREASAVIKTPAKPFEQSSPPKPQKIIEFECRGCEFVEFKADGSWEAVGEESNAKFSDIDLSEGEWFEYDEKAGNEVSVTDVKWNITRA